MSFSAKAVRHAPSTEFPFTDPIIAYFTVFEGEVIPVIINKQSVHQLKGSDGPLYAVWPGQYKSDVFEIDKLDLLKAFL